MGAYVQYLACSGIEIQAERKEGVRVTMHC